ncbi:alkylated DNA nucleotide flippase Atl1 [Marmoricola sp. OAE513]|uniref:MGMT family protein n=1 Tax=Marmoricola sp. OAE513 TaxID=2817894 RepID=UPI001AE840C2
MAEEEYGEAVLAIVDLVPEGRATTYGLIAEVLHEQLGRGGPRNVAAVMAGHGSLVTWWRVVRADGTLPAHLADEARQAYLGEGTPLRPTGAVDLAKAVWLPPDIHSSTP